jgi:8-oxo-dGTP diphosphatase
MTSLPYTICFCLRGDQVLMLYRNNPPNKGRWNGLGGKIEEGESPLASIHREMMEEASIDLREAQEVRFAGLVTWTFLNDQARSNRGMYAFLARLAPDFPLTPDCPTTEGLLSWKAIRWVCDPYNPAVVGNISRFLPEMLRSPQPLEYRCTYQNEMLQEMTIGALPLDIII